MNQQQIDRKELEETVVKGFEELSRRCTESYYWFFKTFWGVLNKEPLKDNWHIKYLCDEMEIVMRWIIEDKPKEYDLLINISPGESKSSVCTLFAYAWIAIHKPSVVFYSASYDIALATDLSIKSKDVIKSKLYQDMFGHIFQIRKDRDNKLEYGLKGLEKEGGGIRAVFSNNTEPMGKHGHIWLLDDLMSQKDLEQEGKPESIRDWLLNKAASRTKEESHTPFVLVMQRLSVLDPAQAWLDQAKEGKRKLKHICLPATNEVPIIPAELEKFYLPDDDFPHIKVMNKIRRPMRILNGKKSSLGSQKFHGQYLQRPRAAEGNLIQKEWIQLTTLHDIGVSFDQAKRMVNFVADTSYGRKKGKKKNYKTDPSGVASVFLHNTNLYILDYRSNRFRISEIVPFFANYMTTMGNPASMLSIEPKSSGSSIVQLFQDSPELPFNVIEYDMPPNEDHMGRLLRVVNFLKAKRVYLIKGAWNEDFMESLLSFPNAPNDEEVDILSMAMDIYLYQENQQQYSKIFF